MAADCSNGGPNLTKQPCNLLCNTGFECPNVGVGSIYGHVSGFQQIPKCDLPCWKTTNTDQNGDPTCNGGIGVIELWVGAVGPGPHSGTQFIELNAQTQAKLYQDFVTIPGSSGVISFAHAGRTGFPNSMEVLIGTSISDPSPVSLGTFTAVVNTWTVHNIPFTFTGSNYTIIFNSNTGVWGGNFLDDATIVIDPTFVTASSNSPVSVGATINLFSTTVPGAVSYIWSGPNGFSSGLQNPIILSASLLNAGTYTVTITDANGCSATSSTDVFIIQGPCYLITDCEGNQPPFVTGTDLSQYVGQTVQTCINVPPPPSHTERNKNFNLCVTLIDCCDPLHQIIVPAFTGPGSSPLVVTFPLLYPGTCWTISGAIPCTLPPPANYVFIDWASMTPNVDYIARDTCGQCEVITGIPCNIPVAFYEFTNCCDPQNILVVGSTDNNFPYDGLTVQITGVTELGNSCWQVAKLPPNTPTNNAVVVNPAINIVTSHPNAGCADPACPPCQVNWPDGCYCVTIEQIADCTGNLPWPGQIYQTYPDCATCTKKCYLLTDCSGVLASLVVDNDFAIYVGQIVKLENCGDTCWTVSVSPNCDNSECVNGVIATFVDCVTCLPPVIPIPPEPLHPRRVKPGYYTLGCPPEYTDKVNCNFAEAIYDYMVKQRYGVTICCDEDMDKWIIKKQELDLRALYDPTLCVCAIAKCCPPCDLTVKLTVYNPVLICPAPTNAVPSFDYGDCTIWSATAPSGNGVAVVYRDCNNNIQSFSIAAGTTINICALFVFDIPKGIVVNTGVPCP